MDKFAAGYYNAEDTVNYWDGIPIKNIFGRTKQQLNFVKYVLYLNRCEISADAKLLKRQLGVGHGQSIKGKHLISYSSLKFLDRMTNGESVRKIQDKLVHGPYGHTDFCPFYWKAKIFCEEDFINVVKLSNEREAVSVNLMLKGVEEISFSLSTMLQCTTLAIDNMWTILRGHLPINLRCLSLMGTFPHARMDWPCLLSSVWQLEVLVVVECGLFMKIEHYLKPTLRAVVCIGSRFCCCTYSPLVRKMNMCYIVPNSMQPHVTWPTFIARARSQGGKIDTANWGHLYYADEEILEELCEIMAPLKYIRAVEHCKMTRKRRWDG